MIRQILVNKYVQFGMIFLSKLLMIYYFAFFESSNWDQIKLFFAGGDALSYYGPFENLIQHGVYAYGNSLEPYAGRMPHYGFIYYLFRFFGDQALAFNCMVILQIAVEALSIIYLAKLAQMIVTKGKEVTYYLILILGVLNASHSIWSRYILTESLSISCFVMYCYFLFKYLKEGGTKQLLLVGLSIGLVVVLRPYLIVLFFPIGLVYLWRVYKQEISIQELIKNVAIICIPMFVLLSPWMIRNANTFGKFIPLQDDVQAGYKYTDSYYAMWDFIAAWGGSIQSWDKRAAGCIFEPRFDQDCTFEYPEYAFTSSYTREDVEQLRADYIDLCITYDKDLDQEVTFRFRELEEAFKKERPIRYYLISPISLSLDMVLHSGSYYVSIPKVGILKWIGIAFKALQSLMYYLILIFGIFGLLKKWKDVYFLNLLFTPLFILILFGVILKAPEFRFFIHAYPVCLLASVIFVQFISEKLKLDRFKLFSKIS